MFPAGIARYLRRCPDKLEPILSCTVGVSVKSEGHPLSVATYTELGDGKVRVDKARKYGIFDWEGRHIEGALTHADPHLLQWVGGPELPSRSGRRESRGGRTSTLRVQQDSNAAAAEAQ